LANLGHPSNFNGFTAARHCSSGRQPNLAALNKRRHHVRHWPSAVAGWMSTILPHTMCMSKMCCTRLAENTGRKKMPSNRHLGTIVQLWRAISSQLRHVSTIGKKLINEQYVIRMSPQYDERRPTNNSDLLANLGHPSKFQPVSHLGFVTAPTSLNGGQQSFAGCLAVSCAVTLCIYFGDSCLLEEFWQLQSSLCVQVLCSLTLAALLHGTRTAAVSETLWRGTRNGIAELSQRAPSRLSSHHLGHWPHSSVSFVEH